jgi:hypothetical protein
MPERRSRLCGLGLGCALALALAGCAASDATREPDGAIPGNGGRTATGIAGSGAAAAGRGGASAPAGSGGVTGAAGNSDGSGGTGGIAGTGGTGGIAGGGSGPAGAPGGGTGTGRLFPAASWFYQDVSAAPLASRSAQITQWLEDNGGWGTGAMQIDFSIEVLEAATDTPNRTFTRTSDFYTPDCDNVPVPIPAGGAIEGESGYACTGDGDCHLIVVDRRVNRLFEMWRANLTGGAFSGGCLAAWDMTRVYGPEGRGEQCTSSDAAGFPIAPLLFTADEVAAGEVAHAIRFILPNQRMRKGYYLHPATHAGGPTASASDAPTYGTRWRLRADYPLASLPNEGARTVARAMQRYGIALADGGNIALTARGDRSTTAKWSRLLGPRDLQALRPNDFQVIDGGAPVTHTNDCVRTAY